MVFADFLDSVFVLLGDLFEGLLVFLGLALHLGLASLPLSV